MSPPIYHLLYLYHPVGACFVIFDNAFYVANKVIKILLIATGRLIHCSDNDRFKILGKKSKKLEQKIVQNGPSQAKQARKRTEK